MSYDTENLRSVAAYPLSEPAVIEGWMIQIGADNWMRKLDPSDILDALQDDARFAALLLQGDATLLGLHVLKVRREYAERLALRDLEAA